MIEAGATRLGTTERRGDCSGAFRHGQLLILAGRICLRRSVAVPGHSNIRPAWVLHKFHAVWRMEVASPGTGTLRQPAFAGFKNTPYIIVRGFVLTFSA